MPNCMKTIGMIIHRCRVLYLFIFCSNRKCLGAWPWCVSPRTNMSYVSPRTNMSYVSPRTNTKHARFVLLKGFLPHVPIIPCIIAYEPVLLISRIRNTVKLPGINDQFCRNAQRTQSLVHLL